MSNIDIVKSFGNKYNVRLSEGSIEKLSYLCIKKEYPKDEIILEIGQISQYLYIIEKGMLRQFYYKNGKDISEHFSSEGEVVFCIESLFLKQPTDLLIETIEPSTVHLLSYKDFKQLCDECADINHLYQNFMEFDLIVSQRKADSWRFENARERYERFCREYPEAARRASIAHIASYLLMTPETLSRVRAGVM